MSPRTQIPGLTGARFFAAIWVILMHTQNFIKFPAPFSWVFSQGRLGVSFFFVVSGFVLTLVYKRDFSESMRVTKLKDFYFHRFARVFPLHALMMILFIPLGISFFANRFTTLDLSLSWTANLFLIQTFIPIFLFEQIWNAPSWSLSCELVFYLCFPFMVRPLIKVSASAWKWLIILWFAILFFFVAIFIREKSMGLTSTELEIALDYLGYRNPVGRLGEFFTGMMLFEAYYGPSGHMPAFLATSKRRSKAVFWSLTYLILLSVIYALTSLDHTDRAVLIRSLCWFVLPYPAIVALVLAIALGDSVVSGLLESRLLILLGEASFALYIIHWIIWFPIAALEPVRPLIKIAAITLIVPLSVLVHVVIEVPARKGLRNWWERHSASVLN